MFSVLVPRLLSEWQGWHMGPLTPASDGQVGYLFPRACCPASSSPAFSLLGEPCSPRVPGPFLTCLPAGA